MVKDPYLDWKQVSLGWWWTK